MSLMIVGSVGLDTIETPLGKVVDSLGGSAVYASLAASYFSPTYLVGVIGEDYPESGLALLKAHDVNTDGLETKSGKTFRWSGKYENWNQVDTLTTEMNVFADFAPKIPDSCKNCHCLLLANIHPKLQMLVLDQIAGHKWVACDTMNYWISLCPEDLANVIRRVDILFINEEEIRQFTGSENIFTAARKILAMGPRVVVVKRGEYGSVAVLEDDYFFFPAYPVEQVVDPTGAGDTFAGGFMSYLSSQEELIKPTIRNAVRYGTVLASLNVTSFSVEGIINLDPAVLHTKVKELRGWT